MKLVRRNKEGKALFETFQDRIGFVIAIILGVIGIVMITITFYWVFHWLYNGKNIYTQLFEI